MPILIPGRHSLGRGIRSHTLLAQLDITIKESVVRVAVMYGPQEVGVEDRPDPKIVEPTDAILRLSATCICG